VRLKNCAGRSLMAQLFSLPPLRLLHLLGLSRWSIGFCLRLRASKPSAHQRWVHFPLRPASHRHASTHTHTHTHTHMHTHTHTCTPAYVLIREARLSFFNARVTLHRCRLSTFIQTASSLLCSSKQKHKNNASNKPRCS